MMMTPDVQVSVDATAQLRWTRRSRGCVMCEECPKYRPAPSYPHIDPGCRGNLAQDNLLSEQSISSLLVTATVHTLHCLGFNIYPSYNPTSLLILNPY